MPNIGYLNGQFMPLADVKVSVEDRGYQFGDGVYEVVRSYDGVPFGLDRHLERLERSAGEIGIPLPMEKKEWERVIFEGIQHAEYKHCKVYIQITRGTAPRNHQFSSSLIPTVLITIQEMGELDEEYKRSGVQAITVPDVRWGRCDIKSLNLLPNVLAKQQAADVGAFEAIFIREGKVTEGACSNVMMVKNRVVYTPEINHHVLAGVTLTSVIELAKQEGFQVQERAIEAKELEVADELFLVGTTIEVLSVTTLNDKPIQEGCPGLITRTLMRAYSELVLGARNLSNVSTLLY